MTTPNSVPTLTEVTLQPDPGFESSNLLCTAVGAQDPDGDEILQTYAWEVNGTDIGIDAETLNGQYFDKGDQVVCLITLADAFDTGGTYPSNAVPIVNSPPSGSGVSVNPSPATVLDTLTAVPSGFADLDQDDESWRFAWFVNGASAGANGTTLGGVFSKGDEVYVVATPDDGEDLGSPLQSAIVNIVNSPPALASVSVTPANPSINDVLNCNPAGPTDADGDPVTFIYQWYVDGLPAGSGTDTLTAPAFGTGDDVYCVVTPTDDEDNGAPVTSNTVTVTNSPPTLTSVILGPTPATEGTTLTCAPTGLSDPDGDPVTPIFSWSIAGIPIAATGSQVNGSSFDKGDAVQCFVQASDGTTTSPQVASNVVIIQNTPPSATSAEIQPPNPYTNTSLSVTVTGWADADGDTEGYSYQWFKNGLLVPGAITPTFASVNHVKNDVISVTVTPNDGEGLGTPLFAPDVAILNTPPTLATASLSPANPLASDTLTCSGAGTGDLDGDTVTLNYQWYADGSPVGTNSPTLSAPDFSSGQTVQCEVTPNDGQDDGTSRLSNSVVVGNSAPVVATVTLGPNPAYEPDTLDCQASGVTDADGDPVTLTYSWTVRGLPIAATTPILTGASFNRGDAVQCFVTPNDGLVDGTTRASNLLVISNTPPSANSVTVSPPDPRTNQNVSAVVTGWFDIDGDPEGYRYQWYKNGLPVPGATTPSFLSLNFVKGEVLAVQVTPDDGTSLGTPLMSPDALVLNTPPVLATATVTPFTANVSATLTCTGSAPTDLDGDSVTLSYQWYGNGSPIGSNSPTIAAPEFANGDSVWCEITPNDGEADGLPAISNAVTIGNSAPTIASVTLGPEPAYESTTLTCTANGVADADGDAVTLSYAWTVNGLAIPPTTQAINGSSFRKNDVVRCTVTPNDGVSSGAPVASNNVTINNTPPSASAANINPNPIRTNNNASVTVTGWADIDGDPEGYRYQWYVDSVEVVGATTPNLSSSLFVKHQELSITVTPDDGDDLGVPLVSPTVTVLNSRPTVASASVTPLIPLITDTLTCTAGAATDADGDAVTFSYLWFVDGTPVSTGGNTIAAPDFAAGQVVYCEITPNDGEENGNPVQSNFVSVGNSLPTIDSVTLAPTPAYETTTLTCTANNVQDGDGDTVTLAYSWTVNGVGIPATGNTLTGADFNRSDNVQCFVTPNDGTANGSTRSSNAVVIQNSPPSITSVTVTPASPTTVNDLTAVPAGWSDADGDLAGYTYQWFANGTPIPGATSSSLSSVNTAKGQQITVQVTPTDGSASGAPVLSAPVLIANTAPSITSAAITPPSPGENDTLTCVPSGWTDVDGDPAGYVFEWYVGGTLVSSATGNTLTGTDFDKGDPVYCVITPDDGTATGTPRTSATVAIGNTAPFITSVDLSPLGPTEATTLVCSATAGDADAADTVTISYTWTVNGAGIAATGPNLTGASFNKNDTVRCFATPNDGTANGTMVGSNIVTVQNSPPSAASVAVTPNPLYTNTLAIAVPAGWQDLDGDPEGYNYQWYIDSVAVVGATTPNLSASLFDKHQFVSVQITPNDGTALGTPRLSPPLEVQNSPPVLVSASLAPANPSITSTLTCTPSGGTDADGDTLTFAYTWFVDGAAIGATGNTLTAPDFAAGNTIRCEVVANDGETNGNTVVSNTVSVGNTAPTIASVTLGPTPAYETSTLTCTPNSVQDADGDTITLTYVWLVNGLDAGVSGNTLDGTYFDKSDTVQCSVTPNDGTVDGVTRTSNNVVIANSAPTLASVTITPATPVTTNNLSANPSGFADADGDPPGYLYQWFADGVAIPGATSNSLSSVSTAKGQQITVQVTPTDGTTQGAPVLSAPVTIGNTPPSVSGATLTPANPIETSILTCNAGTWTDADGDTEGYTYEWYVGGVLVPGATSSTLDGSDFDRGESVYCVLTPFDGTDTGPSRQSNTVNVGNTAPAVLTVNLTPLSPTEASVLSCDATAADADPADTVTLSYSWTVGGVPIGAITQTLTGSDFNKGQNVRCFVTPSDGTATGPAVGSNTVTILNSPPTASSVVVVPDPLFTNIAAATNINGWDDLDGDPEGYNYQWYINGSAVPGGTTATLSAFLFVKHDFISVEVTPNDGTATGPMIASPALEVSNSPPALASATVTPANPLISDTLTCTAGSATDADSDPVTFSYLWYVDGSPVNTGGNTIAAPDFSAGQVVYCEVTPNDGEDDGAPRNSNFVSVGNSLPTIDSVTLTPSPAYETSTMTCTANNVQDSDGDPVTLTYAWTVNGTVVAGATGTTLTGADFNRGDNVQCRVTPNDGIANGATVLSNAVIVSNSLPSITGVTIAPASPTTTSNLTATPTGWSDADGDPAGYLYQWFADGVPIAGATSSTLSGVNTTKGDVITVQVTPTDGVGQGTPVTSSGVTIANTAPTLASASITPSNPTESSILTCTPAGWSDVDGDPAGYVYEWHVDGVLVPAAISSTLTGSDFDKGDQVTCTIYPDDGDTLGTPRTSSAVTVGNTAPAIVTIDLSPSSPTEASTLTCSATATDVDGADVVTIAFTWTVNGSPIATTGPTLTGADFNKGNTIRCFATPSDGSVSGPTVGSNTVTAVNTAPSATSVVINPNPIRTNQTATAVVSGWTDIDGDPAAYNFQWYINSVLVVGATTANLSASLFDKGDTLSVTAVPNDGTATGPMLTSPDLVVSNTAPTLTGASLSPASPTVTSTLTCGPTGGADIDGDTITYGYAWVVNGSTIAANTSTLAAPNFASGDTVWCVVTPSDGTDNGPARTSNAVVVGNTAPTLASVTLAPGTAYETSTLTCTANSPTDADGDAIVLTYAWTVNGTPIGATGNTLTGADFDKSDNVQCSVTPNDGTVNGATTLSNAVVIANSAPTLASVTITPSNPRTTNNLTANPSGWSDADGDAPGYLYQWFADGSPIPGATSSGLSSVSTSKGESITVQVTPTDGTTQGTPVFSAAVVIANTPPTLTSATLSPASPFETSTLACTPSGWGDVDGDTAGYQYAWFVGGTQVSGATSSTLTGASFSRGDDVYCRVTPFDGTDTGTPVTSNTVTVGNSTPAILTVTLTPTTATEATTFTCAATASDADPGDTVTIAYSWTVGGVPIATTGPTLTGADFNKNQSVRCFATPDDGTVAGPTVGSNTVVVGNTAPSASSVVVNPNPIRTNQSASAVVSGWSDIDGDPENYNYQWFVNSVAVPGATTSTLNSSLYVKHDFISVQVTPNDGTALGTPLMSPQLEVQNTPPVLSTASVTPANPLITDTLTCTAGSPTDADGDGVTFSYLWFVGGTPVNTGGNTISAPDFGAGQVVYCEVTPNDGETAGTPAQSNFVSVGNSLPTIATVTVTPTPAYEATTLTCAASGVNDLDGDPVTLSYQWTVNGTPVPGATGTTLTGADFNRSDNVQCHVTPNDGTANGATRASNAVIIQNSAPTISGATITPASPSTSQTLTAVPSGWSDPDGDAPGYLYQWFVGGTPIPGATAATLPPASTTKGDSITVQITPTDGSATGTPVMSGAVVIQNTAPSITGASVTPASPVESDVLTCSASGWSDPDGDTPGYTYQWHVNGSPVPGATTSTLTGADFSKGDSVHCVITPTDGTASGTPVASSPVVVSNSAPYITSITLTPDPATEASTLTCAATAADADGDPTTISYSWTVNGSPIGATGTTLTGANFSKGQSVRCFATPNDGTTNGAASGSNTVVISNTAPSVVSVSIIPASPTTTQNVTAVPSGWADIDGDPEGYIYQWFVNGAPAGAGSTLNSANYVKGDQITVQITPFDGTASGTPRTSSAVTVVNTAPTAPGVTVTPVTPDVGDDLVCTVSTASFDADGDPISYSYAWNVNGLPSGFTGTILPDTATTLGENWTCVVTPFDGTVNGPTGQNSVTVIDVTAPPAPVLNPIPEFTNTNPIALSGTAEPNSTVTLYAICDGGSSGQTTAIAGVGGGFSFTWPMLGGEYCSFYVTATDGASNVSPASNTVFTNLCATIDPYEGGGYGDNSGSPIDEWGSLTEGSSFSITANMLPGDVGDWYLIHGTDNPIADNIAGQNLYDVNITLTQGVGTYTFIVYAGGTTSGFIECPTQTSGYDDYNDFWRDRNDAPDHGPVVPDYLCKNNNANRNNCEDMTTDYWVRVIRDPGAPASCDPYTITVSNN